MAKTILYLATKLYMQLSITQTTTISYLVNALNSPYDLESSFQLTRFADLKERDCKEPQDVLDKLVTAMQQDCSLQTQLMNWPYHA